MASCTNTIRQHAVVINIEWDKGDTFRKPFWWTTGDDKLNQEPVDLTGCTGALQIRDPDTDTLLHTCTTANGGMELEPAAYATHKNGQVGCIEVFISAVDSAAFTWNKAIYDLEIYLPNTDVRKLFKGTFLYEDEVTV